MRILEETRYKRRDRSHLGRSLTAIERVYGFIVSLAVTEIGRELVVAFAKTKVTDERDAGIVLTLVMAIGALATALPFFQGATVWLEDTYRDSIDPPSERRIFYDTTLLIVQGVLLFVLCANVRSAHQYLYAATYVFAADIFLSSVWRKDAATAPPSSDSTDALARSPSEAEIVPVDAPPQEIAASLSRLTARTTDLWLRTNLVVTAVLLIICMLDARSDSLGRTAASESTFSAFIVFLAGPILILRGAFDYRRNHHYYFSRDGS